NRYIDTGREVLAPHPRGFDVGEMPGIRVELPAVEFSNDIVGSDDVRIERLANVPKALSERCPLVQIRELVKPREMKGVIVNQIEELPKVHEASNLRLLVWRLQGCASRRATPPFMVLRRSMLQCSVDLMTGELLTFIETSVFTRRLHALGLEES